ncbi:C6 zinc finger domain protein [Colletotrichum chrysophilum]|uniref:C6 zinc finger domain protein n=2 Tax=Colletotrichum chrysophilum TaxID=1836956 RepID=A0AAD9EKV6_9PEZI|nr:C6 zinc finger domain protein [Colletotrichum chrysophilum]
MVDETRVRGGPKPKSRAIVRVKTGCKTCRARKIKCDETKPACRKCILTGRTCDGYGIWDRGNRTRSTAPGLSISIYNTQTGAISQLSDFEKRQFEWFMRRTTIKLTGVFHSGFWHSLVLQMSSTEPAVLHAMLALASAHEIELNGSKADEHRPLDQGVRECNILRHYNKSIALLNTNLSSQNPTSIRVAIASCILFVCVEFVRRRFETGYAHLRSGLKLLEQLPRPSKDADSEVCPPPDALVEALLRLDVQTRLVKTAALQNAKLSAQIPSLDITVLTSFVSLDGARQQLDTILSAVYELQERARRQTPEDNVSHAFELLSAQQRLKNDLSVWLQTFNRVKGSWWTNLSSKEKVAYHLIPIYHTMAQIIVDTTLQPANESIYDKHLRQFESIISLSQSLLTFALPMMVEEMAYGLHPGFNFTADMGVIPPLYFVGLKCRNPYIRRQAIRVLATDEHQEGIWDAPMAAAIASEVMRLEEANFYDDLFFKSCDAASTAPKKCKSGTPVPPILPENCRVRDIQVHLPDGAADDLVMSGKSMRSNGSLESFTRRFNVKDKIWQSGFGWPTSASSQLSPSSDSSKASYSLDIGLDFF